MSLSLSGVPRAKITNIFDKINKFNIEIESLIEMKSFYCCEFPFNIGA